MREIKFRAWSADEGMSQIKYMDLSRLADLEEAGVYTMQYTGLTDKNGVEIYEGDICKAKYADGTSFIYEVKIPNIYIDAECSDSYLRVDEYGLEVIGNVHEHLELLKG